MKKHRRLKVISREIVAKALRACQALAFVWTGACLVFAPPAIHADPIDAAQLTITVAVKDSNPPAPITDLVAISGTAEGTIELQWVAPDEDYPVPSGMFVDTYLVRYATFSVDSVGSTTTWWNSARDATGIPVGLFPGEYQTMVVTGLDPGVTTYFAIRSVDFSGAISAIDIKAEAGGTPQANAVATDLVPPTPGNLVSVGGMAQVSLSWDAVPVADLSSYRIYRDTAAPPNNFTLLAETTSTSYVDSGLFGPNSYYYRVSAVDQPPLVLESALTSWTRADVTEMDLDAPAAITNLVAIPGSTEGSIELQWTAPDENSSLPSGMPVNTYIIRYATFSVDSTGSATTWWSTARIADGGPPPLYPGNTQSILLTGLEPGVTAYFAIRSTDTVGNISAIDTKAISGGTPQANTAATDMAPQTPDNLASVGGTLEAIISWSPVTIPDFSFYRIYRDTYPPADSFTLLATTTSTSYVDSGLSGPNTYYYRVSTVDQPPLVLESTLTTWTTAYVIDLVDQDPPAPVTDLVAIPGSTEGSIELQWTAPDEDSSLASGMAVNAYTVHYATFSADSIGNTTTWWNSAHDAAGIPPALIPGEKQTFALTGLTPGVIVYFAIRSTDTTGNVSAIDIKAELGGSPQANAAAADLALPTPRNLQAFADATQVALFWDTVVAPDFFVYRVYRATTTPPDNFALLGETTSTSYVDSELYGPNTYYYRISAVDQPPLLMESELTAWSTGFVTGILVPPAVPGGIKASATMASAQSALDTNGVSYNVFIFRWQPVTANYDGTPFTNPFSPTPRELVGYRVFRSTSVTGKWIEAGTVAHPATLWAEIIPDNIPRYYKVKAYDSESSESEDSMIADTALNLYVFTEKMDAALKVNSSLMSNAYQEFGNFVIEAKQRSQDIISATQRSNDTYGAIIQSVEFDAVDPNTKRALPNFAFTEPNVTITLKYDGAIPGALSSAQQLNPNDLNLYWHNGTKFIRIYGKHNSLDKSVSIKTAYLGTYQLRTLARGADFVFGSSDVSNRLLTPNGDRKNDTVVFIFDNPKDSQVVGKVYDLTGAFVAEMTPGPLSNSLEWDGKANGNIVSGGVYIYQIQGEGKTYNGTIVVVR